MSSACSSYCPILAETVHYNKACCYGLQNNVELAIENLQRAINLDVKYQDMAKTDQDFEQIRGDERFQSLLS
ncbi:MAG: hypothetical protein EWV91_10540 [Microcystis aeruginosa Ma_QC_Ca_00000000_S207]|uniref:Tetratricopeptide repeat protein n=1 Tax=Microcystis aeruginosa Ma_QC_Ca_00000000_S207 TaxID=2486251 RepID=A0A552FLM4_MICAE|nr:MAG: hypothetical protein EWV91_10540 [Microcystis aeruginosa Ma_QC_Ca_00000000_S207]